ncbi:hypothetical protein DTL70_07860 [Streptomyces diacarni]|uniref:DUF6571 domain-containing protein n=2 Tax=Streptomyces diacarni TaxID=2800381 RepID=A0A367F8H8_9ACTN|nr:hypothetical protein DTL70_07860 [Streptomyces diacarni]
MAKKFGTLGQDYRDHVRAAVDADSWQGASAKTFGQWGRKTAEEYDQAKGEAHGVGALFRLAHATLDAHKKAVERARDDAQDAGMDVNSRGHCTMNFDKVAAKKGEEVADGYRENPKAKAVVEEKWTDRIKQVVKATQDADAGLCTTFMTDPKEPEKGLPNGFNGAVGDDVVKKNAARAAKTYESIKNGGTPSPEKLREAAILARAHGDDPEFSRTLIDSLGGPEGLIKTHDRLDDLAYYDDKDHKKSYVSLDKALATNLASATKNPDSAFYKRFQGDMEKAGVKEYDLKVAGEKIPEESGSTHHGQKVRGYQSLVSLMQRGDGYGKQFLFDTADAIRKAEDEAQGGDPDIWDLMGDFGTKQDAHFAHDPLDGILDVMSHDPEASTEYLDPGPEEKRDNLSYLLNKRDWNHVDLGSPDPAGMNDPDKENSDARQGLARAIEAGATGEQPIVGDGAARPHATHTIPEARIMNQVIDQTDPGMGGSSLPENLQRPIANALADYSSDTHRSLYRGDDASDHPGVHGSADNATLNVNPQKLVRVMRGVSDSPEAFAMMHQAEREQIRQDISNLPPDVGPTSPKVTDSMTRAGATMGAFEAIRQDRVLDLRDDEMSEADWNAKLKYHIVGGVFTPLPYVGDAVQRSIDTWTWDEGNQVKSSADTEAKQELTRQWLSSDSQIRHMVNDWAASSESIDEDAPGLSTLKSRVVMGQRDDTREQAAGWLARGKD